MKKKWLMGAFSLMLTALLCGCGPQETISQDFYAMDTIMNIKASGGSGTQSAVNECISYINQLEEDISRTKETSELYQFNHSDGAETTLSGEAESVLQEAFRLSEKTNGFFDPTIAPISDLWKIGTEQAAVPAQEDIAAALQNVGYTRVSVSDSSVSAQAGTEIDLGGIGKGYAADHVAAILKENGVKNAIIALGGNVYVLGGKEDTGTWTVGITDPENPESYFGTLTVTDTSVVTSGDYERYFEQDGKRYCHIFDPATGYPAETDLHSVTVVSTDSTSADAYTTALFVMGFERAWEFCQQNDIQAVFVRTDKTVCVTEGLKDCFALTDTGYTYEA